MQDQLTKRPLCVLCKKIELTAEEVDDIYGGQRGACWYCVADTMLKMDQGSMIPDPVKYGRPGETIAAAIARYEKNKTDNPPIDAAATVNGTAPAPGHVAPALTGQPVNQLQFNDQERKDFAAKFGIDPIPKTKPTEIVVYGANEQTYFKFSIPLPIDQKEEQEVKRIMQGMLEIWGKLFKYGPQFASTLLELQNTTPEMLIGGRGK